MQVEEYTLGTEKKHQNVICQIFYKTCPILINFFVYCPE